MHTLKTCSSHEKTTTINNNKTSLTISTHLIKRLLTIRDLLMSHFTARKT